MEILQRFLNYVKIDTQADEYSSDIPSSDGQWKLAKLLFEELRRIGAKHVSIDEHGYVFATIPATVETDAPVIGFLAHMDTAPAVSGAEVDPRIVEHYDGSDIPLDPENGIILSVKEYPSLLNYKGQDLIVTNGKTLLGADNKAGIAEIMAMAEYLLAHPELPHGWIRVGFTIDEEIGRGTDEFDVEAFGADFAYTVDGGDEGEIQFENFNAAAAHISIKGVSFHPGYSKDRMKNALLIANEFNNALPAKETPAGTEDYEGFFHLEYLTGEVEKAEMKYLIRDHDKQLFTERKALMEKIAEELNQRYGENTVTVEITDTYYNMREQVDPYPELIENAKAATIAAGIEPIITPIRGGTDGAMLSYKGLPCPNLGTGGQNFHSRYEYIALQTMEKVTDMLIRLALSFTK